VYRLQVTFRFVEAFDPKSIFAGPARVRKGAEICAGVASPSARSVVPHHCVLSRALPVTCVSSCACVRVATYIRPLWGHLRPLSGGNCTRPRYNRRFCSVPVICDWPLSFIL
jgi:hypothetical protein